MPLFKVGERDLLFVRRNTESDCPLVDCGDGRFRIIKEQMYGDAHRPLIGIREGIFLYGKRADSSSKPLTFARFRAAIAEEVQRRYTAEDLQALKPVPSAQPGRQESPRAHPDQPAPRVTAPPTMTEPMSEVDKLESEALKRNEGNPVLGDKPGR
jgi:hypothetical protein